jgi:hypothetical protein
MASQPWSHIFTDLTEDGPDYRWAGPTESCLCGNDSFACIVRFESQEIAMYFTDVRCLLCGAYLIAPTEVD